MNAPNGQQQSISTRTQPQAGTAILAAPLGLNLVVQPQTMRELLEYATMVASSGMVPKDYIGNPGAVVVAMQMGAELGLSPMAALQNIAVINGRPSVWGDAGLAIVKNHRDFVSIVETRGDRWAKCVISRRGQPDVEQTFTVDDAIEGGLLNKAGPWKTSPMRMLQMRARWFAMRDQFPDALRGLTPAEEAIDMPPVAAAVTLVNAIAPKPDTLESPLALAPKNSATLDAVHAFEALGVTAAQLETTLGELHLVPIERFKSIYREIKQNPKRKAELFGASPSAAADINARFANPPAPSADDAERALADAARVAEVQS